MRHYTLKTFLRLEPNEMLAQYFEQKQIPATIDFRKLKPRNVEPMAAFINSLPIDRAPSFYLEGLKDRKFRFEIAHDSAIRTVTIRKMTISFVEENKVQRVDLHTGSDDTPDAIYAMLDKFFPEYPADKRPALSAAFPVRVDIQVKFAVDADTGRQPSLSFYLTQSDSTNLDYEGRHLEVRNMLYASGVLLNDPRGRSAVKHASVQPA
jgi:hypothetical protein